MKSVYILAASTAFLLFSGINANATATIATDNAYELAAALGTMNSELVIPEISYTLGSDIMSIDGEDVYIDGCVEETSDGKVLVPSSSLSSVAAVTDESVFTLEESDQLTDLDNAAQYYGFSTEQTGNEITLSFPFITHRLLVTSETEPESYGANNMIIMPDGTYIFQYASYQETKAAYENLRSDGADVIPDVVLTIDSNESSSEHIGWGADYIKSDAYNKYLLDTFGSTDNMEDIYVAVIDSGVDYNHPFLNGRIALEKGYDVYNGDSDPMDTHSHGTHVSGIICDTTLDNVSIIPYRITDSKGNSSLTNLITALIMAVDNNADIINLSLGSDDSNQSIKAKLKPYIDDALTKGIIVVSAAGNKSTDANNSCPANIEELITVSACDSSGSFASSYSNYGNVIDVCAPGTAVKSSILNSAYGTKNGTSMACPYVSSVCAMLKTIDRSINTSEAEHLITSAAVDAGEPGFDIYFGHGILNAERLLAYFKTVEQRFNGTILENDTLLISIDNSDGALLNGCELVIAKRNSGVLTAFEKLSLSIPNKNAIINYSSFSTENCDEVNLYIFNNMDSLVPLSQNFTIDIDQQKNQNADI